MLRTLSTVISLVEPGLKPRMSGSQTNDFTLFDKTVSSKVSVIVQSLSHD